MEFISKNIEETSQIATNFAEQLYRRAPSATATIVGLYGELGSGKTTFMKYLAKAFGIEETIQSPTFVIEKIYDLTPSSLRSTSPCEGEGRKKSEIFDKLIHIDAYRLEKAEEMLNLGWAEIIANPKNLICVEWPEKIADIMPPHIMLKFEHAGGTVSAEGPERSERVEENQRKITII